jgi:hypothetical protein
MENDSHYKGQYTYFMEFADIDKACRFVEMRTRAYIGQTAVVFSNVDTEISDCIKIGTYVDVMGGKWTWSYGYIPQDGDWMKIEHCLDLPAYTGAIKDLGFGLEKSSLEYTNAFPCVKAFAVNGESFKFITHPVIEKEIQADPHFCGVVQYFYVHRNLTVAKLTIEALPDAEFGDRAVVFAPTGTTEFNTCMETGLYCRPGKWQWEIHPILHQAGDWLLTTNLVNMQESYPNCYAKITLDLDPEKLEDGSVGVGVDPIHPLDDRSQLYRILVREPRTPYNYTTPLITELEQLRPLTDTEQRIAAAAIIEYRTRLARLAETYDMLLTKTFHFGDIVFLDGKPDRIAKIVGWDNEYEYYRVYIDSDNPFIGYREKDLVKAPDNTEVPDDFKHAGMIKSLRFSITDSFDPFPSEES